MLGLARLSCAMLYSAALRGAPLRYARLDYAMLGLAMLCFTRLRYAALSSAKRYYASLRSVRSQSTKQARRTISRKIVTGTGEKAQPLTAPSRLIGCPECVPPGFRTRIFLLGGFDLLPTPDFLAIFLLCCASPGFAQLRSAILRCAQLRCAQLGFALLRCTMLR